MFFDHAVVRKSEYPIVTRIYVEALSHSWFVHFLVDLKNAVSYGYDRSAYRNH